MAARTCNSHPSCGGFGRIGQRGLSPREAEGRQMTHVELLQRRLAYGKRLLADTVWLAEMRDRIKHGESPLQESADQLEASIALRMAFLGAMDEALAEKKQEGQ